MPNAALRFTPPLKEDESSSDGGSIVNSLLPRRPKSWTKQRKDATAKNKQQRVWVERDGQLIAVAVTTGATDGTLTEIVDGDIEPGMALVVDILKAGR